MHPALRKRMDQTVKRNAFSGYGAGGAPSFAAATSTHKARVDEHQHLVIDQDGREVMARAMVIVGETSTGGAPSFGIQDKLTMPDGTIRRIVAIATQRHFRSGVHHQEISVV